MNHNKTWNPGFYFSMTVFQDPALNNYENIENILTNNSISIQYADFNISEKDPIQKIIRTKISVAPSKNEEFQKFLVRYRHINYHSIPIILDHYQPNTNEFEIIYKFPYSQEIVPLSKLNTIELSNEEKFLIVDQITQCFLFLQKSLQFVKLTTDNVAYDKCQKVVHIFNINFEYYMETVKEPFFEEKSTLEDQFKALDRITIKSYISVLSTLLKTDINNFFPSSEDKQTEEILKIEDIFALILQHIDFNEGEYYQIKETYKSDREILLCEAECLFKQLNENDLKELAKQGYPPAQRYLAIHCENIDEEEKQEYLIRSADNGERDSQYILGTFSMKSDVHTSFYYLFLAMKNGYKEAFLNLAILIYENSSLGEKYNIDILGLLENIISNNDSNYYLGFLYKNGFKACSREIPKKLDKAVYYFSSYYTNADKSSPKIIFVINEIKKISEKGVSVDPEIYDKIMNTVANKNQSS